MSAMQRMLEGHAASNKSNLDGLVRQVGDLGNALLEFKGSVSTLASRLSAIEARPSQSEQETVQSMTRRIALLTGEGKLQEAGILAARVHQLRTATPQAPLVERVRRAEAGALQQLRPVVHSLASEMSRFAKVDLKLALEAGQYDKVAPLNAKIKAAAAGGFAQSREDLLAFLELEASVASAARPHDAQGGYVRTHAAEEKLFETRLMFISGAGPEAEAQSGGNTQSGFFPELLLTQRGPLRTRATFEKGLSDAYALQNFDSKGSAKSHLADASRKGLLLSSKFPYVLLVVPHGMVEARSWLSFQASGQSHSPILKELFELSRSMFDAHAESVCNKVSPYPKYMMGLLAMSLANCAERGRRVFDHWFESRAWHGHIPSRVRVMLGDMADNYRAYRVLHGGDEYSSLPRPSNPYGQPRPGVRTPNPRDPCSGPIFSGDGPPPTKVDRLAIADRFNRDPSRGTRMASACRHCNLPHDQRSSVCWCHWAPGHRPQHYKSLYASLLQEGILSKSEVDEWNSRDNLATIQQVNADGFFTDSTRKHLRSCLRRA